jgi:3-oxosteroid 1-dehydrogenase
MQVETDGVRSHAIERADDLVVVVGAGLAGLATALRVAVAGRPVVVLEASPMIGGAAAYSGGQVWVGANHVAEAQGATDSLQQVETYVRAISADHPEARDDEAMLRWIQTAPEATRYWEQLGAVVWEVIPGLADYHAEAAGATPGGRYLTARPIEATALGNLAALLRTSPYFPVGVSYAQMLERGRRRSMLERSAFAADTPAFGAPSGGFAPSDRPESLTFGPAVVGSFLRRLQREPNVLIRLGSRIDRLSADETGRVVGAACGERSWSGPVVLATSTFDWNPALVKELHGIGADDFGSVAPKELRGDAITLARSVGADVALVPPTSVPMKPGWVSGNEVGFSYGAEYALPHSMIVDASGQRFCDDSYWVDIVGKVAARDSEHRPFYLIWDSRHHEKYGLGSTAPGEPYLEGAIERASSIRELGQRLGIDADSLAATAREFSADAIRGVDRMFGRGQVPYVRSFVGDPTHEPNPVLGPIDTPPFYGMRLKLVSTGIGSSGVRVDATARVLDASRAAIPGLFAVGSCAALTTSGSGYNSGFALSRALTHAYIVGGLLETAGSRA